MLPDGIVSLTVDIPGTKKEANKPSQGDIASQSRWRTKEFCAYYAVFVLVVPQMARSVVRLSRGKLSLVVAWSMLPELITNQSRTPTFLTSRVA